jgi:hypothetical protein
MSQDAFRNLAVIVLGLCGVLAAVAGMLPFALLIWGVTIAIWWLLR